MKFKKWIAVTVITVGFVCWFEDATACTSDKEYIDFCIEKYSEEYKLPSALFKAMVETESSYRTDVVSSVGAVGLMQILPKWHKDRMDRLNVTDLTCPDCNIHTGIDYMSDLLEMYDLETALMTYNEGSAGTQRAKKGIVSNYAKTIIERAEEINGGSLF